MNIRYRHPGWTTLAVLTAGLGTIACAPIATAQTDPGAVPAPMRGPQTYEQQQRNQAWATRKIALSPLRKEWVTIQRGNRSLKAMVTYPEGQRKAPVVLVGHEVFGLTDSTLNTAVEIAQMGYVTIAPDYLSGYGPNGGGTSSMGSKAGETSTSLEDAEVDADINAWADYGLKLPQSNGKFAIVGLSWSGGAAFRYVLGPSAKPELKGVFVFYDVGPPTTRQARFHSTPEPGILPVGPIKVPVFGFYPTQDTRVIKALPATQEAMRKAGNRFEAIMLEGADHAYLRVGEDPADPNPANIAAVKATLARLKVELGKL
ncbi:dienelactone hydrolase family protein [Novosphingobium umbonatum]|uniref:Dienelactone hydrolase family protein n=1 Tax=Novosphingobium umbonatum TaxID=1908524 RepID=A0A437MZY5_9SPHN|nr:dienelactone hydrolase family protein [Novosphingobium umbonatum]RVU03209.1 dienelactone hydrolase family protein [Novosphingobium umbonatum]